ncbi:MAG: response regulator, partial [bacterium]|nr:response regulator [bacterium]
MSAPSSSILVCNDDRDMLRLMVEQLKSRGYDPVWDAEDGEAGIEMARRMHPDLVVSDVSMPRVDGFQLCRILKSPLFADSDTIPVILTSATYRDVIAEQVARSVKAFAYLQQPYEPGDLYRLIELAMGRAVTRGDDKYLLRYLGTVAVVDDDPEIVRLLKGILESEGWCVETAASSGEAMALLSKTRVHLVMLDYQLPDMNGLETLQWIKTNNPDAIVIMTTANTAEDVIISLIKNGADDYIRKPFTVENIVGAARSALNKYNFLRVHEQFQEKI